MRQNTQLLKLAFYFIIIFQFLNLEAKEKNIIENELCTCDITSDSLTLVALYNATNGANWTNIWDLRRPVIDWYGVKLNDQGCVLSIELSNNQLDGSIPILLGKLVHLKNLTLSSNKLKGSIPSELGHLMKLEYLFLDDNQLSGFIPPELGELIHLKHFYLGKNQLKGCFPSSFSIFCDIDYYFTGNPDLPNNGDFDAFCTIISSNTGISSSLQACRDSILNLYEALGGQPTEGGIWTVNNTNGVEFINSNEVMFTADTGLYVFTYSFNNEATSCSTSSSTVTVRLINCETIMDEQGGEYFKNQLIIKFNPNVSRATKNAIRESYNCTLIEECIAGDFELWQIPDTIIFNVEGILVPIGDPPHEIGKRITIDECDIDDFSANYSPNPGNYIKKRKSRKSPLKLQTIAYLHKLPPSIIEDEKVKVAIIDSGLDTDLLEDYIWQNPSELGNDEDGNFMIDRYGYNFVSNNTDTYDYINHGTPVAGRILNGYREVFTDMVHHDLVNSITLMNLKVFNSEKGQLFHVLEAFCYALEQGADIVVCSSGFYAKESNILNKMMEAYQDACILVVASAGNEGLNTDMNRHYPSGLGLYGGYDHIISTAASHFYDDKLSSYSNFGQYSTDIAYLGGLDLLQSGTGGNTSFMEGTSFANGGIAGIAAVLKARYPMASYKDIRNAIFRSTNVDLNFPIKTKGIADFRRAEIALQSILETATLDCKSCIVSGTEANITLKDIIYPGTYQALETITSDGLVIDTCSSTTFLATKNIHLTAGFEVEIGAEFLADIVPCEDNNYTNPPVTNRSKNTNKLNIIDSNEHLITLTIEPNPFQSSTLIRYSLEEASSISMQIVDISGRIVQPLIQNKWIEKGIHQINFNAKNLNSGIYFLVLKNNKSTQIEKLILGKK